MNPVDLTGLKDRLKLTDPSNGYYFSTNENENGLTIDVDTVSMLAKGES